MEFVILGKTTRPKDELKNEIKKLGGKVVTKIHDKLAAVISTPGKVCGLYEPKCSILSKTLCGMQYGRNLCEGCVLEDAHKS
jgi:hypothetical protein